MSTVKNCTPHRPQTLAGHRCSQETTQSGQRQSLLATVHSTCETRVCCLVLRGKKAWRETRIHEKPSLGSLGRSFQPLLPGRWESGTGEAGECCGLGNGVMSQPPPAAPHLRLLRSSPPLLRRVFPGGLRAAVRSQTAVWEEGRRGRVHVLGGLARSLGLAGWVAEKVSFLLVGSYPLKPCTFLP